MKPLSIYIHIPFCIRKCNYCDFLSAPADDRVQEEYLRILKEEIRTSADRYSGHEVRTVYIGGGTPSVVDPERLCGIVESLRKLFSVAADAEISMEVNPGTVKEEALHRYKKAGINRLSIGLQSANDKELKLLGRIHDYSNFLQTYTLALQAGFTNINVDLMWGLPGQSLADYERTLRQVLSLSPRPAHISAYGLIIEEGTPFYARYGEEVKTMARTGNAVSDLPSEEEERGMDELTERLLTEAGYHRYEISNYSLTGKECRHNKVYWQRGEYVGFGLGAASLFGEMRSKNKTELEEYLKSRVKAESTSRLSKEEQMEEFMFLGLRMTEGVDKKDFFRCFGMSVEEVYGTVIEKNKRDGLLEEGERLALTKKGRDVSNYVMAQFLL